MRHVKVVSFSASRTGRLYPQECSWYSFSANTLVNQFQAISHAATKDWLLISFTELYILA
jgi:hypothetical protein